ncbi:MAG: ParB/RepB/Spo0J family partition protein [Tissierellia bacterium]|nr:ParB/RepB/Spo0J family partition protein [Tissierellia bacterium]
MSNKKKALGRGLNNFLKDSKKVEELLQKEGENLKEIPIDEIIPNPNQPRRHFAKETLEELSKSIEEYGILQPLVLRKIDEGYEIIAGERRYRGAKLAGLSTVPGIIMEIDEEESHKVALIENIQREDLDPVEEAMGYQALMKNYNLTQEGLSKVLGKSRSYISNTIRLLKLHPKVLEFLQEGKLSISHGKLLLQLKDQEKQYKKALEIIREGSTIKETTRKLPRKDKKDIFFVDLENRFEQALGTKVYVKHRGKKKKIEIEYYSDEDLERIMEILGVDYE